eukprot:1604449-Pleurochrysis_carterae.AAC.1
MGDWRLPFCRMVGYSSGEWLGLYSPNVKRKALYKMVVAFCRMVNTILLNSLCIVFRYGEQVIPSMYEYGWPCYSAECILARHTLNIKNGMYPPILQNGTSWTLPFCKMLKPMTNLQSGRPFRRIVDSPLWAYHIHNLSWNIIIVELSVGRAAGRRLLKITKT